ncbi:MAG TPA: HEPN domain-containing protein [Bryobacteraceae bacterium]|nr:HEPN domain-containing protein [Bryobacteraceae bacterium]
MTPAAAHTWLDQAHQNLHAASLLIAADAHADALFHCQHASEEALKAFLTFHGRTIQEEQTLSDLSLDCLAIDGTLESVVAHAENLTQHGWRFRDAAAPIEPGIAESRREFITAEALVLEIERRLPRLVA